jgi:hypothetical protein
MPAGTLYASADKYLRPVESHKCNYCRLAGLYELGAANFEAGNREVAISLLESASKRLLSQNMACCGFERSAGLIIDIRGRLRWLYTEELVGSLAESGEYHKVHLARALRSALSGFGSEDVKSVLGSRDRLSRLVENNGNLPEIEAYNKKNNHLSLMHTKVKLIMLDNIYPEAGIETGLKEKDKEPGNRKRAHDGNDET